MGRRLCRVLALLALVGGLNAGAGQVAAAPPGINKHCVIEAAPLGVAQRPAPMRCFSSQLAVDGAIAPTSIALGKLYDYTNASTSGRWITITGGSCSNYGVPDLRTYSFNDLTSSLGNGCGHVTLYTALNYTGTSQTYGSGRTNYVGDAMNNQATAVVFKP